MFRNIMTSQIGGGGKISNVLTIHLIENDTIINEIVGTIDNIPYTFSTYTTNQESILAILAKCDQFKNLSSLDFYCAEADLKEYDRENGIIKMIKNVDVYQETSMTLQFISNSGDLVTIVSVPIST